MKNFIVVSFVYSLISKQITEFQLQPCKAQAEFAG
jgi:hypothetical protein